MTEPTKNGELEHELLAEATAAGLPETEARAIPEPTRGNGREPEPCTDTATPDVQDDNARGVFVAPAVYMAMIKAELLTELATANRLRAKHGDDLYHTTGLGWLCWDGMRWAQSDKRASRMAHSMGEIIRCEGFKVAENPNLCKAFLWHAREIEKARGIESILKIAKSLDGLDGDGIEWDACDPFLLTCPNGVVNLKTGELREHRREDFMTLACPTNYVPDAECPRWEKFIDEIFVGDQALITYFRWVCGYALTASTHVQIFFVLYGSGSNGKSTLLNCLMRVLGTELSQ